MDDNESGSAAGNGSGSAAGNGSGNVADNKSGSAAQYYIEDGDDGIVAQYYIEEAEEHLYNVTIFGRKIVTTVTGFGDPVEAWINDNIPPPVENTSLFIGFEVTMLNAAVIAMVQMCSGRHCLIIQVNSGDMIIPEKLKEFILRPDLVFFGMNVEYKLYMFMRRLEMGDLAVPACRDLGDLAAERYGKPEMYCIEVAELFSRVIGRRLERPTIQDSDILDVQGILSGDRVHCACIDVFACFELARFFKED